MCGAACAGIGRAAEKTVAMPGQSAAATRAIVVFHIGRMAGYAALGALAASTVQGVGWLSTQSTAFRPVWTFFHICVFMLGLLLLIRAEQPLWLEGAGRGVWNRVQQLTSHLKLKHASVLLLGFLWALMPCGLLYAAVLVAGLSNSVAQGAALMALFALGNAVVLTLGPWLWLRLRGFKPNGSGAGGVRLAGFTLMVSAGWALWMGLVEYQAPWCLVPPH
jgi:sulfite exporter TauE/SafE